MNIDLNLLEEMFQIEEKEKTANPGSKRTPPQKQETRLISIPHRNHFQTMK